MQISQLTYSRWSPSELCISGITSEPRILIDRLMLERGTKLQFRNFATGAYTISFPDKFRPNVERAMRYLERD